MNQSVMCDMNGDNVVEETLVAATTNENPHKTKSPNVEELLEIFVQEVVHNFENYCHEYYLVLRKQKKKSGKWSELFGDIFDVGKGFTEGIAEPLTKAATIVPVNIFQKVVYGIGAKFNREEVKKLTEKLYEIRNSSEEAMRETLVDASIEIFRCYEQQFMGIKVDGCSQRAIEMVAEDVTNRIVSYLKTHPEEELCVDTFTKSVVWGTSKKGYFSRGFTVKNYNGDEWNTSEMFEKVGLIYDHHQYYQKLKNDKFGGRLMFKWESPNFSDDGKSFAINNSKECVFHRQNTIGSQYKYTLTDDICEKARKVILEKLNEKSNITTETLNSLKQLVEEDFGKLSQLVEENFDEVKTVLNSIYTKLDEITSNVDETLKTVKDVRRILTISERKVDKDLVWFRVRDIVPNFSGRKFELKRLHQKLWKSTKIGVAAIIVAITGVSGIGKTELAIKYIHEYNNCYEKVVWINAKESATLDESFRTLAQDYLELPMEETFSGYKKNKTMQKIVENVYTHFTDKQVLFVFDNVDSCKCVVDYLPVYRSHAKSKSPFVLITTNNREWGSNVEILDLDMLGKVDAINLVRKGLADKFKIDKNAHRTRFHQNVQEITAIKEETLENEKDKTNAINNYLDEYQRNARDLDNNVNVDDLLKLVEAAFGDYYTKIEELVETLGGFPLAIQQAISHINYQKKMSPFYTVGNYLDEYAYKTKTLLDCDKFLRQISTTNRYEKTTYTACTITLDKIKSCQDNHSNLALQILDMAAYFSPDNIPIDFFAVDDDDNNHLEAVRLLHEYSLIKVNEYVDSFSIHRLHQQVVRLKITDEGRKEEEILREALRMVGLNTKISYTHVVSLWSFVANGKKVYTNLIDEFSDSEYFEMMSPLHLLSLYRYGEAVQKIVTHLEKTNPAKAELLMKKKDNFLFVPLLSAAIGGSVEIVEFLEKRYRNTENVEEVHKRCLHLAAIYGHVDLVKHLIVNEKMKLTTKYFGQHLPFELAVFAYGNLEIVKFVLEQDKSVIQKKTCYDENCLHLAASSGQLHLFKYLIKELHQKCRVYEKDYQYWTPLHHAARNGHKNIIHYLTVQCRVDVNEKNADEENCLHIAARNGHLNLVKYLVKDHSMAVRSVDKKGYMPYYHAAQMGHVEIVRYFSKEHNVNDKTTRNRRSCLHSAVYNGHLPLIRYLVEVEGTNVHMRNDEMTALECAKTSGNKDIIEYLEAQEAIQKKP